MTSPEYREAWLQFTEELLIDFSEVPPLDFNQEPRFPKPITRACDIESSMFKQYFDELGGL